jgi:hypothetical protein
LTSSSLIVARLRSDSTGDISRLFAASDAGDLPQALGVRQRRLFRYQDLYFHYVEFAGESASAMSRATGRDDFRRLSDDLAEFIAPYDPATWRTPADAMAHEFYAWSGTGVGGRP